MTFEEFYELELKHLDDADFEIFKQIWETAQQNLVSNNSKFDGWWEYHKDKKFIKTTDQSARWAWTVQQADIESMEKDFYAIAALLNLSTEAVSCRTLRNNILDKLKS